MAGERRINFGADATDAQYRTEDDTANGRFKLVEDLDGGVVLLEYDEAESEWVYRGPVNMSGNDVTNVGALDATSVSADDGTIASFGFGRAVNQSQVGQLTVHANDKVSVSADTFQSVFNLGTAAHCLGGIVNGRGLSEQIRITWSDDSTSTLGTDGEFIRGVDANGEDTASLHLPAFEDVKEIEFKNELGASEPFGYWVLTV
jgi:hypothetical protein